MKHDWVALVGALPAAANGAAWVDAKFMHLAARIEQSVVHDREGIGRLTDSGQEVHP